MYVVNVSDSAFFRVMVVRFKNIDKVGTKCLKECGQYTVITLT